MPGLFTNFFPFLLGCYGSSPHFLLAAHSLLDKKAQAVVLACLQSLVVLQGFFLLSHVDFLLWELNGATFREFSISYS